MSEHKTAKHLLKEKFLDVEMQITDESLGYSLSQKKINEFNPDRSFVITYASFVGRFAKLSAQRILVMITFCMDKILVSGLRHVGEWLDKRLKDFTKARLEKEIQFDSYLKKIENKLIVDKNNAIVLAGENDKIALMFESKYLELFLGADCSIDILASDSLRQYSYYTLEFKTNLLKEISEKLEKSNMLSNVENVRIRSILNDKTIRTQLEFELKVQGEKWVTIFSKHILSGLEKIVSSENGAISTIYKFYPKEKKEIVFFSVSHDLIFKSSHVVEKIKIERKVTLA